MVHRPDHDRRAGDRLPPEPRAQHDRPSGRPLDQTAPATAALSDSSQRSWGNYGARYSVDLDLRNPSSQQRTVRLVFGSNVTGPTDVPGNTWNEALAVSIDGAAPQIQTVYVRPTAPRDTIGTYTLAPAPPARWTRLHRPRPDHRRLSAPTGEHRRLTASCAGHRSGRPRAVLGGRPGAGHGGPGWCG
ncbi:DUF3370 family protein [Streptomyces sp. NPDC059810]|uniref:DUF3370 family protein n=1 Tax=Streptomyces sp. NPDC059810 TaxID=3346956 RepID=UPI00366971C3